MLLLLLPPLSLRRCTLPSRLPPRFWRKVDADAATTRRWLSLPLLPLLLLRRLWGWPSSAEEVEVAMRGATATAAGEAEVGGAAGDALARPLVVGAHTRRAELEGA